MDRRSAWVLAVGLVGGYGFWLVLEVEGEREVGGSLNDGFWPWVWVLAMGMGMTMAFFFLFFFPLVVVDL